MYNIGLLCVGCLVAVYKGKYREISIGLWVYKGKYIGFFIGEVGYRW